MRKKIPLAAALLLLMCCQFQKLQAQAITIRGTVYDISARRPLEAVAVFSSSGTGAITDSLGHYSISVNKKDSIWFSLIGKSTMKYPVDTINNTSSFDVMIHVYAAALPEVKVRNSYYRLDSLQNRRDNAKAFDFKKPGLRLSSTNTNSTSPGLTVGFDLDEIINMFRTKRNRNMEFLQKRLVQQEQDKYIDHRFSKQLVRKLTKLQSPELETFMIYYRPQYEILQQFNELELGYYIEKSYEMYRSEKYKWQGGLRR